MEIRFKMRSSGRGLVTVFDLDSRIVNTDAWFSRDQFF